MFTDAVFRANPFYELVLYDRLSHTEREVLGELADGDALYGVLRARRGSELELRAASRDTALLLFTLKNPGPLPHFLRADLGADLENAVARLVLDGVLQIEHRGSFVSGADARDLVLTAADGEPGRIAMLSVEALQYGQALEDMPTQELALRLYCYGRKPVSPIWQRQLANEAAARQYLGLIAGGAAQAVLDRSWTEVAHPRNRTYWRVWRPRHDGSGSNAGYKLYISADPASLPGVFPVVVASLADGPGVRAFKVGRDVFGLCRPDNLVVYFSHLEDLHAAASRLTDRLEGSRACGVPFTAEVTRDGLLSWGIDPPAEHRFRQAGSWRLWVVGRLAEYLVTARTTAASAAEPWRFALDRLSVDGIDTDTWVPESRIFGRAKASG